jgi:hypothetical protein
MTLRIATIAALVSILVSSPAWCDRADAPRDQVNRHFYASVGWFEPTDSGLNGHTALCGTYSWHRSSYYGTVEYTRSTHDELIAGELFGVEDQAITVIGGVRRWSGKWYYGAGLGVSTLRHEILTPLGGVASSDTDFAWEIVAGAPFAGRGLAEVKYIDAGNSAARGFAAFVGVTY